MKHAYKINPDSKDEWPREADGSGVWWTKGRSDDDFWDADDDGLGAFRGVNWALLMMLVLAGALFAAAEVMGAVSMSARVGIASGGVAALAGWRCMYLFQGYRDWKPAAFVAVTFGSICAWSLLAWGW